MSFVILELASIRATTVCPLVHSLNKIMVFVCDAIESVAISIFRHHVFVVVWFPLDNVRLYLAACCRDLRGSILLSHCRLIGQVFFQTLFIVFRKCDFFDCTIIWLHIFIFFLFVLMILVISTVLALCRSQLGRGPGGHDLGDLGSLPVRLHQVPHFGKVHRLVD